jgi:hypothetical protein
VKRLSEREREATAHLVAHLAELDLRRLYLQEGCSSLFTYCTRRLHLSEHEAYARIEAARAARQFPVILELLENGSIHLTAVGLLAPHLTPENHVQLLEAARHKSKRQVEEIVARIRPLPPVPATVRKLPSPRPTAPDVAAPPDSPATGEPAQPSLTLPAAPSPAPRPVVVAPLAPERYKVQFTAGVETCEKLREAQDLLRHVIPDGDPAAIFDRALTVLLAQLRKTKHGATERPRASRPTAPGSRHIPAEVKRQVWKRDGGRCAFVSKDGRRCEETGFLEFHHVEAYALGGQATVGGIQLRCRAHNAYEAERVFGPRGPLVLRERLAMYACPGKGTRSGPSPTS